MESKKSRRKQLRKEKKDIKLVCDDNAFKFDCMRLILTNFISLEDSINIRRVCRSWDNVINQTYKKCKQVEITFKCNGVKYILDCFGPCFDEVNIEVDDDVDILSRVIFIAEKQEIDSFYVDCRYCGIHYNLSSQHNPKFIFSIIVCPRCENDNSIRYSNVKNPAHKQMLNSIIENLK